MRQFSEAFRAKIKDPQRVEHVRGNVGGVSFVDRNIIHLAYQNQCSDNKDVTFGSARIGQLTATFWGLNIPRYSWRGLPIKLDYGLEIDDEGTIEWVDDLLTGTIGKAEWTASGVNITSYDCLADLDTPINFEQTSGQIFDMLALVSKNTGILLGVTKEECEALPNGTEMLGLYQPNNITTYRDFLSAIATAVGGFATTTGDGKLKIKSFADSEVVFKFEAKDRVAGSVFSDYITNYDGIVITDAESGAPMYYFAEGASGGISINIGANPLLQFGIDEVKNAQRQRLAEVAHSIAYVPFQLAITNCPVFELGDLIECEGGVAGSEKITCCVMAIDWTFKYTTSMQGFGADPNLTAGKSKTDKALAGLASKTKENEVVIHTYTNSEEYILDNHSREPVVGIDFATMKPCIVTMQHEINLDLDVIDELATVTAYYYLNDELQSYQPVGTFSEDGKHIIPLMYFLNTLEGGTAYEWRVELEVNGGNGTIDRGDVHAWLQGQGLVALDDFAGTIHVEDHYEPVVLNREIARIVDVISELTIADYDVKVETLSDLWNVAGLGEKDLAPLYDRNVAIEFAYVVYALCDDLGAFAVCDDTGNFVIVNSDGGYT